MPVYEYVCQDCEARFEARRPMSDAGSPMACPDGHVATTRVLSVFAAGGRAGQPAASTGGCGAGCACAS
jgi:putative FmdB family regulatory protein